MTSTPIGLRRAVVLLLGALPATVALAAEPSPPEGWRQFRFGMSPEAALAELGDAGERYGGSIRSAVDIDGERYLVLMNFRGGRLHDVFLKSSLDRARAGTDPLCAAYHRRVVGELAANYGREGETERSSLGDGARYVFTRTRMLFANGTRIVAETKFVPSLEGNGLCDSSLSYQDAD